MYEYVITAGEGTMIELGVCEAESLDAIHRGVFIVSKVLGRKMDILISPCTEDCETGQ